MNESKLRKFLFSVLLAFCLAALMTTLIPLKKAKFREFSEVVTPRSVEDMLEEYEHLETTLEDVKRQLADVYARLDATLSQEDFLREELEYYKLSSGYKSVQGEGVIVLVTDSRDPLKKEQNPNTQLVHDVDINLILQELQNAGAEALSVNGERVLLHRTKLVCNGPTIRINERVYSQPFLIEAIGARKELQAVVYSTEGYVQRLRRSGIFVEANTSIQLEIPAFEELAVYSYLQEVNP